MKRGLFFDKDGVLTIDKGVGKNIFEMELYPASADTIAYFRNLGFQIFVITNQPVVARGIISEEKLLAYFETLKQELLKKNLSSIIDRIYYCPHHPSANLEKYRIRCECRKPKPGMLISASREFDIDLTRSYMIGDRITDIVAGSAAGCKTVQCLTGRHEDPLIETDMVFNRGIEPDHRILNLEELKQIIQ
ncbi:MAG: D,D-heptose 1,7-bisphosphate phosphatase [Spirochaetae bacterium HGW-Spirochaetae-1]|jgi:D-glycero-D-manno-heptose 1,7-bisphosphate phosphatase|nr:MAG: D,D-heptose 1,7-bisphosphate phosphatase [Spirochaetae bacterium HGW-Spirochaetae-1]